MDTLSSVARTHWYVANAQPLDIKRMLALLWYPSVQLSKVLEQLIPDAVFCKGLQSLLK